MASSRGGHNADPEPVDPTEARNDILGFVG
jgi:hypothetical protein